MLFHKIYLNKYESDIVLKIGVPIVDGAQIQNFVKQKS